MLLLFFLFFFFSYSNGNIDAPALYSAHNFSAKRIQKRRRNTRARNWNRIKFDGEDGTAAMVVSCICVFLRLIYECLRVFPLNAHAVHLFYISFFFVGAFIYYSLASRSIVLFRQNHNYYYFHRESTTTAAEAATWVSEWVSVIIIVFFSKKVLFCVAASAQFPHREHSQRRNRKKSFVFTFLLLLSLGGISRPMGAMNEQTTEFSVAAQFIGIIWVLCECRWNEWALGARATEPRTCLANELFHSGSLRGEHKFFVFTKI